MTLDLSLLDGEYKKYALTQDGMSDLKNAKKTKEKNADFRKKLDYWKAGIKRRKT